MACFATAKEWLKMTFKKICIYNNNKNKKNMTTQSLKRLLEFTFTFVGSFVQDGLGRHNFAIPSGKKQEHRIQDEWVDKVTTRQQEESAPTTCMPIFINFPWLPDYRRKHEYKILCATICVHLMILRGTENFVWLLPRVFVQAAVQ